MLNLFIHSWTRVLSTRHSCWNLPAFPMDETEGELWPLHKLLCHLQIPLNLLCCRGLTSSSMTAMLSCSILLTIHPFCESENTWGHRTHFTIHWSHPVPFPCPPKVIWSAVPGESKLYIGCWFNTICYGLNVFWPRPSTHTNSKALGLSVMAFGDGTSGR